MTVLICWFNTIRGFIFQELSEYWRMCQILEDVSNIGGCVEYWRMCRFKVKIGHVLEVNFLETEIILNESHEILELKLFIGGVGGSRALIGKCFIVWFN